MAQPSHLEVSPFWGRRAAEMRGGKRILLKIFPLHVLLQLKFELQVVWARLTHHRHQRAFRGRCSLLVNIGSGSRGRSGWVNTDVLPMPGVDCVCDCRRGLPFDDGSVDVIFSEHFFEHIDYTEEAPYFLAECRRVLAPGGVVRIIVPDAGRYLQAYAAAGWSGLVQLRQLQPDNFDRYTNCRYRTKMELVNEIFRQAGTHKFAYDAETLIRLLQDAGFSRVQQQSYGQSFDERLRIDLADREHESLYVEAVK